MEMQRGALIVIEGVDRTGKSTQCKALVESLRKLNIKAESANFPNRTTPIGKIINSYLESQSEASDEAVHLLFSANRWEAAPGLERTLLAGTTLLLDRYCYSGVAFSAAKGLDVGWCRASDAGLPRPDCVLFLSLPPETSARRAGYGRERYERLDFQQKVAESYLQLRDDSWAIVDADRSVEEIQAELVERAVAAVRAATHAPLRKLWL